MKIKNVLVVAAAAAVIVVDSHYPFLVHTAKLHGTHGIGQFGFHSSLDAQIGSALGDAPQLGTGNPVRISGYEEWTLNSEELIAESKGHFDEAEYQRQLNAPRK